MAAAANPLVTVSLRLGSGNHTAANVNADPHETMLSWDPAHWLATASDGSTEAPWSWLAGSTYAAFFFCGEDVGSQTIGDKALHCAQISSGFQVAIDHGLDRAANYGSVKAALQNFVIFCREKRAAHRVEFTFDDATAAIRAPTTSTSALSSRCEVAGPSCKVAIR